MKDSNELFELCKQVYEATGWENDPYIKHLNKAPKYEHRYGNASIYTSDYLLEKLPNIIERNVLTVIKDKKDSYEVGYAEYGSLTTRSEESDTPLKALLKLTLRLHEEGLL